MLSNVMLVSLMKYDMVFKQGQNGKVSSKSLAIGTVKVIYNISKVKENDLLFLETDIL